MDLVMKILNRILIVAVLLCITMIIFYCLLNSMLLFFNPTVSLLAAIITTMGWGMAMAMVVDGDALLSSLIKKFW